MKFYRWYIDNDSPMLAEKIEYAKKDACTPIRIDKQAQTAYFKEFLLTFTTTLYSCDCSDNIYDRPPCRHMIRLAMELGYIDKNADRIVFLKNSPIVYRKVKLER